MTPTGTPTGPKHRWYSDYICDRYDPKTGGKLPTRKLHCSICNTRIEVPANLENWRYIAIDSPCRIIHQVSERAKQRSRQPGAQGWNRTACGYHVHWRQPPGSPLGLIRDQAQEQKARTQLFHINCPDCIAHNALKQTRREAAHGKQKEEAQNS